MNRTVVLFESRYGFTKRYAQWLAETLACPLFERKDFPPADFAKYDTVLYGGGLYAGGVSGIKMITQNWKLLNGRKVVLFTCGLADPAVSENTAHIRAALSKVLSAEQMTSIKIFHLRGGIHYSRLSLLHRTMMSMLRRMLLKKNPSELSSEDRLLLDTYGTEIDFTDRSTIQPILNFVCKNNSTGSSQNRSTEISYN